MPVRFLVLQHHIGGALQGAFDGERLIGFIHAVPGVRNGVPYWNSHMLAVAKDYRNSGIGSELKLAQRDQARQRGIRLIEWTFDPLESKNAYMNIEKLGVIIRRYYVNHYGHTTASLQHGLDSDRVVAEWWIDRPRVPIHGDARRISIPADIQALKRKNLESARAVQRRVRGEFMKSFEEDYLVVGFDRTAETGEYLLIQGASRVHQTD